MTTLRQVVQGVADHGIVLDFQLVAVFENQQSLRQICNRLLRWSCGSNLSFRLSSTPLGRVDVYVRTRCWRPRSPAIKDGGATPIILRILRLISLLIYERLP